MPAVSIKCPHCLQSAFIEWTSVQLQTDRDYSWYCIFTKCPACARSIIKIVAFKGSKIEKEIMANPKAASRPPLDPIVDKKFASDYEESCLVLQDSPKASAALSRRCLQNLLREKAGIKKGELSDEIQQVIDSKQLPSYLTSDLDAVRNIGNFAAHPNKSKITGEIVDVEPTEAEWLLNVLESLFDFYFVQPENARKRRDGLNNKLSEIGKPPMK
jgi:hypothetical protein